MNHRPKQEKSPYYLKCIRNPKTISSEFKCSGTTLNLCSKYKVVKESSGAYLKFSLFQAPSGAIISDDVLLHQRRI